jgi:N-acetylglucosamine kinase-like BadF-type ATPase
MPEPGTSGGRQPFLLAVDGGASKTDVALVAADGRVLGRARGPASNHQMVGLEVAMDNIASTLAAAAGAAGLTGVTGDRDGAGAGDGGVGTSPVCAVGSYCLAGIDLAVDENRVGQAVRARGWTTEAHLWNDTFAVLRAGTTGGWGVGVVCGTGLNCVALGPDGASVRFPALGELSGDFAPGGVWLGIRGLGLALRAGDGRGEPTVLRELVAAHFDEPSPEAVLEAVYSGTADFGRLAGLAEVVLGAASAGDGPATGAVDVLVGEVVTMVGAAITRLGVAGHGDGALEVVAGGGIFEDPRFSALVLEGVRRSAPEAVLRTLEGPPVLGAALLGLDAAGAGPSAEGNVRATLGAAPPVIA